MENWKGIMDFPDYEVSDLGRIRVKETGVIVKQHENNYGYNTVVLYANGEGRNKGVHRIVASAFIRLPSEGEQVNHKDGNKTNNSLKNLEWVTQAENLRHSREVLGNKFRGMKREKGSYNIRINLRVFRVSHNMTQEVFANEIGVSRAMYSLIEKGDRFGSFDFWLSLQNAFAVPDEEMFKLMKIEK